MSSPLTELLKACDSLHQQFLDLSKPFLSSSPLKVNSFEHGRGGDTLVISRTLLQALTAASTSSLSYAFSLQSIISKFQASLLEHSFSGVDASHRRAILIDDLRALLREIGDSTSREGRHFQQQLTLLTEQLAQAEALSKQRETTIH